MDKETRELDGAILKFIAGSAGADAAPDARFEALAARIFDYQFTRNVNYRRFCEMEGKSPGSVGSWDAIPAMPAAGFKELVLATFSMSDTVKKFRTSGTTQSLKGVHFFDTLKLYEAAIVPSFERHLLADRKLLDYFFLLSPPKDAPDSSLSHMMGLVNRRFARSRGRFYFKKGQPLYRELLADLKKTRKPVFLLATAFSLKGFLERLAAEGRTLKLASGSRLMETGGFKGRTRAVSKKALYAECRKRLGLKPERCHSEYGMTELSSQFYATAGGPFRGPAWVRTAVVDPVTGRRAKEGGLGVLRHFDLANRGSVMAVQTEDVGRERRGAFELQGRASESELRGCSLTYEEFLVGGSVGRR